MMERESDLTYLVKQALACYPLINPTVELIRHNENATYRVTDAKGQYVMRIHRPTEGFSLGIFGVSGHSVEYLQSEMEILLALHSRTDLPVQQPVKNLDGSLVTLLCDQTPVTLLEWIKGETVEKSSITGGLLQKIGGMAATIHQAFRESCPQYPRYAYDDGMLTAVSKRITEAQDRGVLQAAESDLIGLVLNEIRKRMGEIDRIPGSKGLVHSDLSKSNLIVCGSRVAPIDFSLCGYCSFYMDIASLFCHFSGIQERQSLMKGYRQIWREEINPYFIEPFFALQIILFIACQYEKVPQWDWFRSGLARWGRETFEPLCDNQRFLGSIGT